MQAADAGQPGPSHSVRASSLDLSPQYVLGVIRRAWILPVLGCLLGLVASIAVISITPSFYKSNARLFIDRSTNRYLQANKIIDQPMLDDADTASQIYILSSESVIVPVVRTLNLTHDPEFVGPLDTREMADRWAIGGIVAKVKQLAGWNVEMMKPTDTIRERLAVEAVLRRLQIYREDVANVINITFSSADAGKAAAVANGIAENYIAQAQRAKSGFSRMTANLLQTRLSELRQQLADAEKSLQDYRQSLSASERSSTSSEQISSLSAQLALARIQMAEAKTRFELAEERMRSGAQTSQVADNEAIARLRAQQMELTGRLRELEARVGPGHAAAGRLRKRIEENDVAIRAEQRRLVNLLLNEYELAKARSAEIEATLKRVGTGSERDNEIKLRLRELETSAQVLRDSYNSMLQRFNDASRTDDVVAQETRIITRAEPPLQKGSRRSLLVLGGGLVLGLLSGIGAALGRELMSGTIRTPGQARALLGTYCAVLPTLKPPVRSGGHLGDQVLKTPFSRFTEAFRNVRAILMAGRDGPSGLVVGVVSCLPEEGKTTVACNLAALLASSASVRVLVIDGDLHRCSLTRRLTPDAKTGLIEAIREPERMREFVVRSNELSLDVLPCVVDDRLKDAADVLRSKGMEQLIAAAKESYDFIILETAPISPVVDVKEVEALIDRFVLVVEWGTTKYRLIEEALLETDGIAERLACVVLNKVDPVALRHIEAYKGARFGYYYQG